MTRLQRVSSPPRDVLLRGGRIVGEVFDLPYNLPLAACLLLVLAWIWRDPRPDTLMRGGLVVGLSLAALATLLARNGFHLMRLVSWGLFVHGPVGLIGGGVLLLARGTGPVPETEPEPEPEPGTGTERGVRAAGLVGVVLGLLLVGVAVDAFLIEPTWLEVSHHRLQAPGLREPLRIVLVADMQTDHIGEYQREVLRRVVAEKPDLVLFAGDYLQCHSWSEHSALSEPWRQLIRDAQLAPRLGAFAVKGDCEYSDSWRGLFAETPVRPLQEEQVTFPELGLELYGLSLGASRRGRRDAPARQAPYRIWLGHAPDVALTQPDADLILAGHTHGGQVQLPVIGPLLTLSRVPRGWAAGRTELPGGGTLIVSRGIGMERHDAPRLRFLCRPELVVLELVPAPRAADDEASGG